MSLCSLQRLLEEFFVLLSTSTFSPSILIKKIQPSTSQIFTVKSSLCFPSFKLNYNLFFFFLMSPIVGIKAHNLRYFGQLLISVSSQILDCLNHSLLQFMNLMNKKHVVRKLFGF